MVTFSMLQLSLFIPSVPGAQGYYVCQRATATDPECVLLILAVLVASADAQWRC